MLERTEIEQVLQSAMRAGAPARAGITIWMQNWTNESFDRPADFNLDWSVHFDRATRRVPQAETWNRKLLPELADLKKRVAVERAERLIYFRGKCALSSGFAIGATFPVVGGWRFEVPQPPSRENWRSDAKPTAPYALQAETVAGHNDGTELVLALNIKGDGRDDVRRHIEGSALNPKLYVFVAPPAQGTQAIRGPEDASAFALALRDLLGDLLKKNSIRRTHVFFYGPLALSIFVGQQLTSVGEVQLYEYQDPGYVPSCTLRT